MTIAVLEVGSECTCVVTNKGTMEEYAHYLTEPVVVVGTCNTKSHHTTGSLGEEDEDTAEMAETTKCACVKTDVAGNKGESATLANGPAFKFPMLH